MANPNAKSSQRPGTPNTDQIVHRTVRNYQLTSRSKKFWRLRPHNETKIAHAIRKKGQQDELALLAQKQSYYTDKLHDLLNRAAEERDPRLIQDQQEADWFIRKHVVSDPQKLKLVEFQVWKQQQFHAEFGRELSAAEPPNLGLVKLRAVNLDAEKRRQTASQELYLKYAQQQRLLAKECEDQLRDLEVPFFTGPALSEDKQFVLDLLFKWVEKKAKPGE